MTALEKKAKRLDPIIDERKARFDQERQRLAVVRQKKLDTIAAMKQKQREYMEGVARLNSERGSANRLMLEALETGLDSVKQLWMKLYHDVLVCEQEEKAQTETMSQAHRDLEAIKHLQTKYNTEVIRSLKQRELQQIDEIALRKFTHS